MSYTSSGILSLLGTPQQPDPTPQVSGGGGLMDMLPLLLGSQGQGGPNLSQGPPDSGSTSHWEQVARQMAERKFGWGPQQFKWLDWTISGGGPNNVVAESHWDPKAVNPAGAYGIPQMYAPAHPDVNVHKFMQDPMMQIRWLLNYVHGRYGDPHAAYEAKVHQGTY